jgi:M6 family metalloprotease-like protein
MQATSFPSAYPARLPRSRWLLLLAIGSIGLTLAPRAIADPPAAPAKTASASAPAPTPRAAEYRTVDTAIKAVIAPTAPTIPAAVGQIGYLGISLALQNGKVMVEHVDPQSPAATAGVQAGDRLLRLNTTDAAGLSVVRETLLALPPGTVVKMQVTRQGKPRTLTATMAPLSLPRKITGDRAVMGAVFQESTDGEGLSISRLTPDFPAEKAGLQVGDVVLRINEDAVIPTSNVTELLAPYSPNDTITVQYRRAGKTEQAKVTLAGEEQQQTGNDINSFRRTNLFKKEVFRMAVIGIEYPDVKHSAEIGEKDWEASFFSAGTYTDKSATGQPVFGSLNDYYKEISCGKLRVEGKMFAWVTAEKNRAEYAPGNGDRTLLPKIMDKILERDGNDALDGYDGVMFIYAGGRASANRGNLYWPHRSTVRHKGKRWPYFICPEGGARMTNISVFVHEFGHMLGLPDLYARPENPGSEGMGQWCVMSNQLNRGRPQHPGPWCKEQLGWLTPTVISPNVKQTLVLSPIEGSTKECFKVLARPDGSEYFLIEVRKKTGYDTELPGEGLLIWRVVRGRPILEEAHGVEGPMGPRSFLREVPFPSVSNRAFTPFTTPSSKSQLGGGTPVYITDIERLPDGRVSFRIGYETL